MLIACPRQSSRVQTSMQPRHGGLLLTNTGPTRGSHRSRPRSGEHSGDQASDSACITTLSPLDTRHSTLDTRHARPPRRLDKPLVVHTQAAPHRRPPVRRSVTISLCIPWRRQANCQSPRPGRRPASHCAPSLRRCPLSGPRRLTSPAGSLAASLRQQRRPAASHRLSPCPLLVLLQLHVSSIRALLLRQSRVCLSVASSTAAVPSSHSFVACLCCPSPLRLLPLAPSRRRRAFPAKPPFACITTIIPPIASPSIYKPAACFAVVDLQSDCR
jgi:hypothetical protein